MMRLLWLALLAGVLGGCQFLALDRQMKTAQRTQILIPGELDEQASQQALVALFAGAELRAYRSVQPGGLFYFSVAADDYQLLAFEDRNGNLRLDPDEPRHWLPHPRSAPFQVQPSAEQRAALARLNRLSPSLADTTPLPELDLSLERLYRDLPRARHNYLQVVDFDDPRFSAQRTQQGAWQPLDFLSEVGYGLYLLEPWDDDKEPIVLVHGINSSPTVWRELVAGIDRERFQLLLFHYPSGLPLNNSAYLLSEALRDVQLRLKPERLHLFAHSMGGLVARRTVQLLAPGGADERLCLFLTLATPWGGHPSAATGVSRVPVDVPVWRDMSPGSSYLQTLFAAPLPAHIRQWQLVSYAGNSRMIAEPNDGTVPLASELLPAAQDEAERLYLLEENHTSILASARSQLLLQRALDSLPEDGCRP
ncbi:esterase/lipase family protein [Aquipseudomonas alcaligenes]|uniref:esterase/lipase family protein n=1 Tax=Aquipseudomonas alcaligenes TaxID=43263 RepID=UPI0037485B2B